MDYINVTCRKACREIKLPANEKRLFMRLLREISVNATLRQSSWQRKEHFLELWAISVNRFPELAQCPYNKCIADWIALELCLPLSDSEKDELWT